MEDFSMGNQRLHFTLGLIYTSFDPWPYDSGYGGCGPAVHFIVTFPVFLILSAVDSNKLFKHEPSNNDPILGTSSRRGSRPFLSPDERPDIERDGSGSSLGGRSTRSGRRDSLSPDSANEDGTFLHLSLTEHFSVNSRNLCFRLANSEAGFAPFIISRTGRFPGSLTG